MTESLDELFAATLVGFTVWELHDSARTGLVVQHSNDAARRILGRPLQPGESADRILNDPRLLLAIIETAADRSDRTVENVLSDAAATGLHVQARTHALSGGRVGVVLTEQRPPAAASSPPGAGSSGSSHEIGDRAQFLTMLYESLAAAKQANTPLAVVVLDIDRFKEVNDTLGHSQGDVLLHEVSRRLAAFREGGEVFGVCRIGGDEFALLASPRDGVVDGIGARVASTFAAPFAVGRMSIRATASVGVSSWPAHGDEAEELLRKADVAMWAAKQSGRGMSVYRVDDDKYNLRRLRLVSDLRDAIADEIALELHYQPKLDLASGRVVGAEALVRWAHPEFGQVPPGEFVPMAEDSGLIGPLSHWVIAQTGRQLRSWHAGGIDIDVSANISARNLYDPQLVRWLSRVFDDHDVRPGQLTLELTESQVAADLPMARQILRRLHALGVKISIDDFGTGYSSLSYLSKLPLDELKIDRSFVCELATNHGAAVVQTIIGLGHDLGLHVVAEGVETGETMAQLQGFGCDQIQGDHISRPLDVPSFESWLVAEAR